MTIQEIRKSLPESLARELSDYRWREIFVGRSTSKVFRLESSIEDTVYLKISPGDSLPSLREEKKRLQWLDGKLPVPRSLLFAAGETENFHILSEISGVEASSDFFSGRKREIIEQSAIGLKMFHNLSIENCPFDARLDYKIRAAKERMLKGLVDEEDFDDERSGRRAEDLFEELLASRPPEEDLVFTHGDYCLPNIIIENGKLSGFVDLGSAGVADKYQDIALLTRSVAHNFGECWTESVFELYGVEPDWKKIEFYKLLDEFF